MGVLAHEPEGLVVAFWIQRELVKQDSVSGDHLDVGADDEEQHLAVAVGGADLDVAEPPQVAECDPARLIDLVLADPVLGGPFGRGGPCLEAGVEDGQRGLAAEARWGRCWL